MSHPGRLLLVCTGNIARSAALEHLLRHALAARASDLVVGSAGTEAVVGAPVDPPVADLLRARGVDPEGFAARQLTAELVAEADLVIALTRRHRSAVVELVPAALHRTFTLLELARTAPLLTADGELEPGDLPALAARASRSRTPVARGADDVRDPHRASAQVYRDVVAQIAEAGERVLPLLTR